MVYYKYSCTICHFGWLFAWGGINLKEHNARSVHCCISCFSVTFLVQTTSSNVWILAWKCVGSITGATLSISRSTCGSKPDESQMRCSLTAAGGSEVLFFTSGDCVRNRPQPGYRVPRLRPGCRRTRDTRRGISRRSHLVRRAVNLIRGILTRSSRFTCVLHTSAPLRPQYFRIFSSNCFAFFGKNLQNFVIFEFFSLIFAQILMKFCRNFADNLENVEIFWNFWIF